MIEMKITLILSPSVDLHYWLGLVGDALGMAAQMRLPLCLLTFPTFLVSFPSRSAGVAKREISVFNTKIYSRQEYVNKWYNSYTSCGRATCLCHSVHLLHSGRIYPSQLTGASGRFYWLYSPLASCCSIQQNCNDTVEVIWEVCPQIVI